jgi:hypothetical protein
MSELPQMSATGGGSFVAPGGSTMGRSSFVDDPAERVTGPPEGARQSNPGAARGGEAMSTSLEERLYARELRALYRANRHNPEPFSVNQSEAFQREARRRARLRAQDPREHEAHAKRQAEYRGLFQMKGVT